MKVTRREINNIFSEAFWSKKKIEKIEDITTVGDLRKLIASAQGAKRWEQTKGEAGNAVKDAIVDEILGKIPGAASAKTMFDFLKTSYDLPDEKRSGTALDYLDVDDEIAAIVDDPVENAFLKALAEEFKNVDGNTPMSDINITNMLSKHIEKNFKGRTVAGFENVAESSRNDKMKITQQNLRHIISTSISHIIMEDKSGTTEMYDDDSALRGDQSELPDALQKSIIEKSVEDRDEREEADREEKKSEDVVSENRLRQVIRKLINGTVLNENVNKTAEKKIRHLMRSIIDSQNGLKFGSLTNVLPSSIATDHYEFTVKITMNAGALRNAIQSLKSRGFDIDKQIGTNGKRAWDPKQSRLSALFLNRDDSNINGKGSVHQLDYDMKLGTEATAPLRKAFQLIAPSAMFNPIDFIGSTKGFVHIIFEGLIDGKDLDVEPMIGTVTKPISKPRTKSTGKRTTKLKSKKSKQKTFNGVSPLAVSTVTEILADLNLDIAEELDGDDALRFEEHFESGGYLEGVVRVISDRTNTNDISSKYDHIVYKVIKSTPKIINDSITWTNQIQPTLDNVDKLTQVPKNKKPPVWRRYGGPDRRIPGQIISKNKQSLYVATYVEILQDKSKINVRRVLPRGKVIYYFLIYAVTERVN